MSHAAVELDERKAIPRSWKDAARGRSGGVCAYPECEVSHGLEYDHILCLGLGGKHRADNIQPLCGPHHLQKTKLDVKMIARAKRRRGETGQYARRQKRGGGSIKGGGFGPRNRKMDGTIGLTAKALRLIMATTDSAVGMSPVSGECTQNMIEGGPSKKSLRTGGGEG